jgi:DNA-binding CsgD family transcriptional regulator
MMEPLFDMTTREAADTAVDLAPYSAQSAGFVAASRLASLIGTGKFAFMLATRQKGRWGLSPVIDHAFPGLSALSRDAIAAISPDMLETLLASGTPRWIGHDGRFGDKDAMLAMPLRSSDGRLGLFLVRDIASDLCEDTLLDCHAGAYAAFDQLLRLRSETAAPALPVSQRELDCLRMTAAGMTSETIAAALGLSIHTANQYLAVITQKLDAVNRMHAVAKALRAGLIA